MTHDISISITNVIQGGFFISKKQQNRFNSQLILWPLGPFFGTGRRRGSIQRCSEFEGGQGDLDFVEVIYIYFFLGGVANPAIVGSGQYIVCIFFMKGTRF